MGSGSALPARAWHIPALRKKKGRDHGVRPSSVARAGQRGICVNTLAPAHTLSDSIKAEPRARERSGERAVLGRAMGGDHYPRDCSGHPHLTSADSDFVTGQTLAVDGGSVNT